MLHFTNFSVRTDDSEMIVHNKVTGTYGNQTRSSGDSEADYEEISRAEYEAEVHAKAVREVYCREVRRRIEARYPADEESAIQRKALALLLNPQTLSEDDSDEEKAGKVIAEFNEYNDFAESVKADVAAHAEEIYAEEIAAREAEGPDITEEGGGV